MKLFKMEAYRKPRRSGLRWIGGRVVDVVVLADDLEKAKNHVAKVYPECDLRYPMELHLFAPKHFVVGEWETD